MSQRHVFPALAIVLLLALGVAGCKKPQPEITPTTPEPTRQQPPAPPPAPPKEVEEDFPSGTPFGEEELEQPRGVDYWNQLGPLSTIYFAFDSDELTQASRSTLRRNAEWLNAHPELGLVIEGHCDERGTIEYNLALGERRAAAVREYLASLGIDAPRMRIITYGEERPVDPGHTEAAWSQNRRAAFVLED